MLTATEVGVQIRQLREQRRWSQEQLAVIAGLNVRAIQRVEQGKSASFDIRRALAHALNSATSTQSVSSFRLPTTEELQAMQAQVEDRVRHLID